MLRQVKTLNFSWCSFLTNEIFQILNCQKSNLLIILIVLNPIVKKVEKGNSNDPSDVLILLPVVKKSSTEKADFFSIPVN